MELRHYLAILRHHWLLIVGFTLAVVLLSAAAAFVQPQQFVVVARLIITQTPYDTAGTASLPDFNSVGNWQASEYMNDDLPQVVSSAVFAQDVAAILARKGYNYPPNVIQGAISAETLHRSLELQVMLPDGQAAVMIARAAAEALQTNGLKYWNRQRDANDPGLQVSVLTLPDGAAPMLSRRRMALDLVLRAVLALFAAIGIAFLLHYLDRTVRDQQQVEALLDIPVVGAIPTERPHRQRR